MRYRPPYIRLIHMNYRELTQSEAYNTGEEIVEVSLLWLIQNTTMSCDAYDLSTFEGWQEMFAQKCADTGFGHLVNSIIDRGFMREGAIGFDDGEITEGHHRFCAAILLGLDTVYVSRWGKSALRPKRLGQLWEQNLVCAHYADDGLPELAYYIDL